MSQVCSCCKVLKENSEFGLNNSKKSKLQSRCKECRKKEIRIFYKNNKQKVIKRNKEKTSTIKRIIKEFKETRACIKCGYDEPCCLEFHHINPEDKKFNIAHACTKKVSLETLMKEIEKCIILCANCHRKLHCLGENL